MKSGLSGLMGQGQLHEFNKGKVPGPAIMTPPWDSCPWHLGTWVSGGSGSIRLTVGLDNLKGTNNSVILWYPSVN